MYVVSFSFQKKNDDSEFSRRYNHLLDVARAMPGFSGWQRWHSEDGKTVNMVFYWADMETLIKFSKHPDHLEAKSQYAHWFNGYEITVGEVLRSYSGGAALELGPHR